MDKTWAEIAGDYAKTITQLLIGLWLVILALAFVSSEFRAFAQFATFGTFYPERANRLERKLAAMEPARRKFDSDLAAAMDTGEQTFLKVNFVIGLVVAGYLWFNYGHLLRTGGRKPDPFGLRGKDGVKGIRPPGQKSP